MTVLTVRLLTCDGTSSGEVCPAEYGGEPGRNLGDLLGAARAAGWAIRLGGRVRTLCPDHAQDGDQ